VDGYAVAVGRLPGGPRAGSDVDTTAAEPVPRSPAQRVLRGLRKLAINLMFVAALGCVAILLGPSLLGYQRFIILTGSMTGTYNRGSIVFDKPVPTASLKVGDVITYNPPPGFTSQGRVSHRIYRITVGKDGVRTYQTKGDFNRYPDIWHFTLPRPTQDEVKFDVPEIGYLFLILSIRNFRLILVGVPAILIGGNELRKLWREGGAEAKRQKLAAGGWRQLADSGSGAVLAPLGTPALNRHFAVVNLRLPARPEKLSNVLEAAPKRRVRLRAGTTLRISRFGNERLRGPAKDRRQSSGDADQIRLGVNATTRRLQIRRLPREVRALERIQVTEDMGRSPSLV
jgi:signal peptidase I